MAEFSVIDLVHGIQSSPKHIDFGLVAYLVLGLGTAAKLVLYLYCRQHASSDSIAALAEDHLNDVFSNIAAIVTAAIAANVPKVWWLDPAGEILAQCEDKSLSALDCACPGQPVRQAGQGWHLQHLSLPLQACLIDGCMAVPQDLPHRWLHGCASKFAL